MGQLANNCYRLTVTPPASLTVELRNSNQFYLTWLANLINLVEAISWNKLHDVPVNQPAVWKRKLNILTTKHENESVHMK